MEAGGAQVPAGAAASGQSAEIKTSDQEGGEEDKKKKTKQEKKVSRKLEPCSRPGSSRQSLLRKTFLSPDV